MKFDLDGKVLLADVPNAGVSRTATSQRSGNPRHDVRSGKFGSGSNKPVKRGAPRGPNQDPLEFARQLDKIRLAARELTGELGVDEIKKWLKGKIANDAQVDPNQFLVFVQQQRMNDLVDAIHARMKGGFRNKGVKMQSSNGYIKGVLRGLTPDQLATVAHRVEALGHSAKDVDRFLGSRIDTDVHEAQKAKRQKLQASLEIENIPEILDLELNTSVITPEMAQMALANQMTEALEAMKNQAPPVIHVTPQIKVEMPPRNRKFIRDPKNGTIIGVEEE